MRNSILICLISFFMACNQTAVDPVNVPTNPFFDLKEYFEQEMKIQRSGVTKTTTFEGEKETVGLASIDLTKELKIFADANLNKVAWYEKYQINAENLLDGKTKVSYTTDDPKLKTKSVAIFRNGETIDSILIHNQMSSMIMDADQFLSYYPKTGYNINIKQEGNLKEISDVNIEVKF